MPTHQIPCLLAIDTSTSCLSIGLEYQNQQYISHEEVGAKQSEYILPVIQKLMKQASVGTADLTAIVCAQGPGAFTGLRIGMGVAQGIATPHQTPLIVIPCLDAIASLAPNQPCVLAASDARMNELFYAWYDTETHTQLTPYKVEAAQYIKLPGNHQHGIGVGNAFGLDIQLPVSGKNIMPTTKNYLALAQSGRYPETAPSDAQLLYVRNKIALTATEQLQRNKLSHQIPNKKTQKDDQAR